MSTAVLGTPMRRFNLVEVSTVLYFDFHWCVELRESDRRQSHLLRSDTYWYWNWRRYDPG